MELWERLDDRNMQTMTKLPRTEMTSDRLNKKKKRKEKKGVTMNRNEERGKFDVNNQQMGGKSVVTSK